MDQFLKDRRRAFTVAVMDDDWKPVRKYCEKYGVPIPPNRKIMKAGIYKACQQCTDLPDEIKETAFKKCIDLGFSPFMNPHAEQREE